LESPKCSFDPSSAVMATGERARSRFPRGWCRHFEATHKGERQEDVDPDRVSGAALACSSAVAAATPGARARPPRYRAPSTGALYLALQRMEAEGLIEESPRRPAPSEDQRRRYWRITVRGRETAEAESERLAALVAAARRKDLLAGDIA